MRNLFDGEQGLTRGMGLKVPVARHNNTLLWVGDASEMGSVPDGLVCIGCDQPLIWRRGVRNRPHFAHKVAGGCGGESALHTLAIEIIGDSIQRAAATRSEYRLDVPCVDCEIVKRGNLGKHTGLTIDQDRVLQDGIRPDILVRSHSGTPLYVIEVVVTHAPDPAAHALYQRLELPVIMVSPEWQSLEMLRTGLHHEIGEDPRNPQSVGARVSYQVDGYQCRSPRHFDYDDELICPICESTARRLAVEIATSKCYRCEVPFAILDFVERTSDRLRRIAAGCADLKGVHVIAADYGVTLRDTYSQTTQSRYLAHHCRNGHFQGDNFIYRNEGAVARDQPVQHVQVCRNGHWNKEGAPIPWPPDVEPQRVRDTAGLWGTSAGLFEPHQSRTVAVGAITIEEVMQRMFPSIYGPH